MKTYSVKAILFDMDGVLIDSNSEIEKFWKVWALKEGLTLSTEHIRQFIHGRTTIDTVEKLFTSSSDLTKKLILEAAIDFDMNMRPALIGGTEKFLRHLNPILKKVGVVTSAPITRATKMLELHDIYNCFHFRVTGDEVIKGKPDPEPYLLASMKLNVRPEECLVFEDSNSGINSAQKAGMQVVAINNHDMNNDVIANLKNYDDLLFKNNLLLFKNGNLQIELLTDK
jgi:HAD superfamily hydrolase (TIGR01509 family)